MSNVLARHRYRYQWAVRSLQGILVLLERLNALVACLPCNPARASMHNISLSEQMCSAVSRRSISSLAAPTSR